MNWPFVLVCGADFGENTRLLSRVGISDLVKRPLVSLGSGGHLDEGDGKKRAR